MSASNNFKVALVWPPLSERFGYYRFGPRISIMGLGYLHSLLKDNQIEAKQINIDMLIHSETDYWKKFDKRGMMKDDSIIEKFIAGDYEDELMENIYDYLLNKVDWQEYSLIALGYELNYIRDSYAPALFKLLQTVSSDYGIPIVIGGMGFASMDIFKFFRRFKFIKYVSFGKIDSINLKSFLNIVQFEKDQTGSLENIDNICYRNEKSIAKINIYKGTQKSSIERDYIIKPVYDLSDNTNYRSTYENICEYDSGFPGIEQNQNIEIPIIPYRFTVNCINKCAFCMCSADGQSFSFKKPEEVVDDIDQLMQENNSPYFMFLNAMINFSKKYLDKLLNLMKKRNINIYFSDSAEVFGMDFETLQMLKELGAVALWYGLESPSNKILKLINKRCTVEQSEEVLKMSDQLGIWNGVNLITGLPHETDEDINLTIDFIKRNVKYVDMWQVTPFYLIRSSFLENPEKYGIVIRDRGVTIDKGEGDMIMASFDEIGGLPWEEKQKKTAYSFKRFLETIDLHATVPNLSNTTYIFYAFTKFGRGNKQEIRKWLVNNYTGIAPKIKVSNV